MVKKLENFVEDFKNNLSFMDWNKKQKQTALWLTFEEMLKSFKLYFAFVLAYVEVLFLCSYSLENVYSKYKWVNVCWLQYFWNKLDI